MGTYTKRQNIIDYTMMGLLSINVILVTLGIPHTLTCFIALWIISIGVFTLTSVTSKIYKTDVLLFILDLLCKIIMYNSLIFFTNGNPEKSIIDTSYAGMLIGYLFYTLITKKFPFYRPLSYLLIYAVTTGICAAITM